MSGRILSQEGGLRETWYDDIHHGEKNIIHTVQDAQPVTDANIAQFNLYDERAPWREGQNHVARIPQVVVEQLMRDGIWNDDKALLRWLDQPENKLFRTRPGKLSR